MNLHTAANDFPGCGLTHCDPGMPVRYAAQPKAVTACRSLRRGKQSATEPWTRRPDPRGWVSHAD